MGGESRRPFFGRVRCLCVHSLPPPTTTSRIHSALVLRGYSVHTKGAPFPRPTTATSPRFPPAGVMVLLSPLPESISREERGLGAGSRWLEKGVLLFCPHGSKGGLCSEGGLRIKSGMGEKKKRGRRFMASFPLPFEHKRASPDAGGAMRKMVEGRRSFCVSSVFFNTYSHGL